MHTMKIDANYFRHSKGTAHEEIIQTVGIRDEDETRPRARRWCNVWVTIANLPDPEEHHQVAIYVDAATGEFRFKTQTREETERELGEGDSGFDLWQRINDRLNIHMGDLAGDSEREAFEAAFDRFISDRKVEAPEAAAA